MRRPADSEARLWLEMAADEYADAEELRVRERLYLALFHFQQATEKALKAFVYSRSDEARVLFTHAIVDLVGAAAALDPDFESVRPSASLDQYYIPTRYPNGLPGLVPPSRFYTDKDEARRASELAKSVLDLVRSKVAPDDVA